MTGTGAGRPGVADVDLLVVGSGVAGLSAAVRAVALEPGHKVIVITYADYDDAELGRFEPRVVKVDGDNRPHG